MGLADSYGMISCWLELDLPGVKQSKPLQEMYKWLQFHYYVYLGQTTD